MLVHSLLMKIKKRLTCDIIDTCAMPDLMFVHSLLMKVRKVLACDITDILCSV